MLTSIKRHIFVTRLAPKMGVFDSTLYFKCNLNKMKNTFSFKRVTNYADLNVQSFCYV